MYALQILLYINEYSNEKIVFINCTSIIKLFKKKIRGKIKYTNTH